jgi:hypothetical protein
MFVPELGSSLSRDTKFLRTLELYWHTKSFVAQAMLAKELRVQGIQATVRCIGKEKSVVQHVGFSK